MNKIIRNGLVKVFDVIIGTINYPFKQKFKKVYGQFDEKDYEEYKLTGLPNQSHFYHGELIKWATDNLNSKSRILLAGEDNEMKFYFEREFNNYNISTSFLSNSDYNWDFEKDPPKDIGKFDIIISQAMMEHLIDPYKHFMDLAKLLNKGGVLIFHTEAQFFPYHRYPIDTLRYFPDWFEEMGKRAKLKVIHRKIKSAHILYCFKNE